jgi:hypothetical protein
LLVPAKKIVRHGGTFCSGGEGNLFFCDHLATTTNTSTSQRHAALLAPPSSESGKAYRSRACYSRQTESHHAMAPKDKRTRATTIANDENR